MMDDQRLKAQRDYQWGLDSARQECLEKGREEGELVGKIQILQELLDEESSPTASLRERTISELSEILVDLQQRLRSEAIICVALIGVILGAEVASQSIGRGPHELIHAARRAAVGVSGGQQDAVAKDPIRRAIRRRILVREISDSLVQDVRTAGR